MRPLHFLEIENFKRFGEKQRIELDHPTVLIGPNNCGKTTAIQALALWSQAVRTWYENKGKAPPKERTSTSINRLSIVAVPVQRTRYFWANTNVRRGNQDIHLVLRVGVLYNNRVEPIAMRFRNQGDELVYCAPDETTLQNPEVIEHAAQLRVELLYPMSGIETEEPVLQPGRIDVLLGQGQTAQVLRNLCLLVQKDAPQDWERVTQLMKRLFAVSLGQPRQTARGSIDLKYRQEGVRDPLDISLAGRGFQQMLLLLAYLYSHRSCVILIDEPDAHLEILRQKQVYVLLRELAAENDSQIILVTHSEVLLDEALDHNLTLLLEGRTEDLTAKRDIRNALQHYGTDSYVRRVSAGTSCMLKEGPTSRSFGGWRAAWTTRPLRFWTRGSTSTTSATTFQAQRRNRKWRESNAALECPRWTTSPHSGPWSRPSGDWPSWIRIAAGRKIRIGVDCLSPTGAAMRAKTTL